MPTRAIRWAAAANCRRRSARLITELARRGDATSPLAYPEAEPVGLANCFKGFSILVAKTLLNIHDVSVAPAWRGFGAVQMLLARLEQWPSRAAAAKSLWRCYRPTNARNVPTAGRVLATACWIRRRPRRCSGKRAVGLMLLPIAALLAAMVFIQFGAAFAKALLAAAGTPGTTALRLALPALIPTAVFRPWRTRIPRPVCLPLLGYGIVHGCMNQLFYSSLRTITLGVAVALEFCGPLVLTLFSLRRPTDAAWLALAVVALLALLPMHVANAATDPRGTLYALSAGACWAIYIVLGRHIGGTLGTQASTLGTVIAAICILPVGIGDTGATLFHAPILLRGLMVAVFPSAIPYTLEMIALTRLSPRLFGTLTSLEPALGAIMAGLLLHQTLTAIQWCAIAAIMTAASGTAASDRGRADRMNR